MAGQHNGGNLRDCRIADPSEGVSTPPRRLTLAYRNQAAAARAAWRERSPELRSRSCTRDTCNQQP